MEMEKLSELYQKDIMRLHAQPYNYEKRLDALHIIEAYNPLCGDKFKLFLDIENGMITKATFHGYGCAISKAASSVLIQKIEQKSIESALNTIKTYFLMLDTEGGYMAEEDTDLGSFKAVKNFPERLSCATLSWQAADDYLRQF